MKQIEKSDLKLGEIYWFVGSTIKFLNKISSINIDKYDCYLYNTTYFAGKGENLKNPVNILEATPEEKHWLETCIKADKFVSYEEAMKTFIPEYVECIKVLTGITIGKILSVENNIVIDGTFNNYSIKANDIYNYFKPSTKEAYDAQFVVKEPEFVLPEKWAIIITNENKDIVNKYRKSIFNNSNISCNLDVNNVHLSDRYDGTYYHYNKYYFKEHTNCEEITTKQFKQYVLKENTIVIEKPKVVLEEPKDKVIQTTSSGGKIRIDKVECSEGGVYKIGDKITVFDKDSSNKGKSFTITGFRWNNAKTEICAGTDTHRPYGIRLSQIELYVEPKVKVTHNFKIGDKIKITYGDYTSLTIFIIENIKGNRLIINNEEGTLPNSRKSVLAKNVKLLYDFVLPENWYIKVTDDNKEVLQQYILNLHNLTMITLSNINYVSYSKWLYGINRTENKLCYGLISKLNLNPLPNIYRTVTYYNGVEITFEQFKKHVLKDE